MHDTRECGLRHRTIRRSRTGAGHASARELSYAEALNEAIGQEMERDPRVFVMGEDIGKIGGIFPATQGPDRRSSARSGCATRRSRRRRFAARAVGAAITGMRPIVEVQIFDFVTHMMDMIVNQAAKFRFMLGGVPTVPLVIRGPQGGGIRLAAQHSQSLEAWFAHVPGPRRGGAIHAVRRQGSADRGDSRRQPGHLPRAQDALRRPDGAGAGRRYAIPIGKADIKRAGTRRHDRRDAGDGGTGAAAADAARTARASTSR